MGDAGEGLIDAESRIQERLEEVARERADRRVQEVRDPEALRALESLRLARADFERQLDSTAHARRRAMIEDALAEIDRRMSEVEAKLAPAPAASKPALRTASARPAPKASRSASKPGVPRKSRR